MTILILVFMVRLAFGDYGHTDTVEARIVENVEQAAVEVYTWKTHCAYERNACDIRLYELNLVLDTIKEIPIPEIEFSKTKTANSDLPMILKTDEIWGSGN